MTAATKKFNTKFLTESIAHLNSTKELPPVQRQLQYENFLDEMGSFSYMTKEVEHNSQDLPESSFVSNEFNQEVQGFTDYIANYISELKGKRGAKPYLYKVLNLTKMVEVKNRKTGEVKYKEVRALTNEQFAAITVYTAWVGFTCTDKSQYLQQEQLKLDYKLNSRGIVLANTIMENLDGILLSTDSPAFGVELFRRYVDWSSLVEEGLKFEDKTSKDKELFVFQTSKMKEVIKNNIEFLSSKRLIISPMLCRPNRWTLDNKKGGFLTSKAAVGLVKGRGEIISEASQEVLDELNFIQEVPYQVNKNILTLLMVLSESRPSTLKKVFPKAPDELTMEKPAFGRQWENLLEEEKNQIRKFYAKRESFRRATTQKTSIDFTTAAAIQQAYILRDENKIYFPHNICYRQRFYNLCMTGLNTQGMDVQKGLLQFSRGEEIKTERGVFWMKVNLANFCGQDKLHPTDRVKWVDNNTQYIINQVENRVTETDWHSWDKPIQGMALAMEYTKWLKNPRYKFKTWMQLDG